jgi:hypothetical protein
MCWDKAVRPGPNLRPNTACAHLFAINLRKTRGRSTDKPLTRRPKQANPVTGFIRMHGLPAHREYLDVLGILGRNILLAFQASNSSGESAVSTNNHTSVKLQQDAEDREAEEPTARPREKSKRRDKRPAVAASNRKRPRD